MSKLEHFWLNPLCIKACADWQISVQSIYKYTEQNISTQHVKCWFHELKYKIPDIFHTHKNIISLKLWAQSFTSVSEHFSFAKIIHPPDRCGISRSWLNSMIITQVNLVLGEINGHSKMFSFVTQHNATDVSHFDGVCKYRNAHQICCQIIEC